MKRTAYMQWLLTKTGYSERLIAIELAKDCAKRNLQSFKIIEATGDRAYTNETFLKAAKIVIESK